MLKEILAITGKPGLFRIKAHNGKVLIVEELMTGKKFPVSMRDRVVSLGDIAIYTEGDDKPLGEVLQAIYDVEKDNKIDIKELTETKGLKSQLEKYLPDFDKDRVRDSDIKKLFSWYNLLLAAGFDKFVEDEETPEETEEAKPVEETEEKVPETQEEKTEESKPKEKNATKAAKTPKKEK